MPLLARRSTVIIPGTGGRSDPDGAHFHIVLTDTCDQGNNLLVPICSVRDKRPHDRTCLLGTGDHDFLRHNSFVFYAMMKIYSAGDIMKKVQAQYFSMRKPLDDPAFALVCAGIDNSDYSEPQFQRYYASRFTKRK